MNRAAIITVIFALGVLCGYQLPTAPELPSVTQAISDKTDNLVVGSSINEAPAAALIATSLCKSHR